jgi:glycosyltransferase involved in cell wall biosynthesis
MRIALLSAEYPPQPGGVGDYTRRLGQALAVRGHDVLVFTIVDFRFQILDLGSSQRNQKSKIKNLQSDWGWRCWRATIAALDVTRPDVLHIQYQTGAYGMRPAINLLPWRLRGLPRRPRVAVTAHDLLLPYLFPKAGPMRRWVTRRLLADADAVVVTNEDDQAQLNGRRRATSDVQPRGMAALAPSFVCRQPSTNPILIPIGSNIPVVPPPGYDRAAWRSRLGLGPGETLVAYFGLISRSKGLHVLLDALARLPASFRLIVVGGAATQPADQAYAAEIERQIDERGLRGRVSITGHLPEAEVSAHLLAADLAALPFADGASFRRGSLLAVLAHGIPVITTADHRRPTADNNSSTVGGRLADEESALLVPPEDPAALAAAIERLAADSALRGRLSGGGRVVASQFAWETIAERHETLYLKLLGRR